jgi:DNA-binding MarR family transcriptional regulator
MAMTPSRHVQALSPAEARAWRSLQCAHTAIVKTLDAELEAAHRLPLTSFEVLAQLAEAPEQRKRMCDVASTALLSRSGLSRLVDRLEGEGLLERVACPTDARGAFARLTPAGRRRLLEAQATHAATLQELFVGHFGADELDLLTDLLGRVKVSRSNCC